MLALLIDGPNLIRRVFAGVPDTASDRAEAVLTACSASLRRALRQHHPSHVVLAMDCDGPGWRAGEYPDYKKNRPGMPDDLRCWLPDILDAMAELGGPALAAAGFEADDVIAAIAAKVVAADGQVAILSTDKSFCQLVGPGTRVFDHFSGIEHDRRWIVDRFGVGPEQLTDLLALAGDSSLGVPGIRSVGVHTAAKLLHDHRDLAGVVEAAQKMSGKLGEKIRAGIANATLAHRLVSLRQDVAMGVNLKDFRYVPAALDA